MHFILCSKRRTAMHQILQSYQNHLFSKLREAGELADVDPTPMIRKLSSLSCWSISSSNWSSYALIRGCLPKLFIDLFVELSIPRQSAMKVVAAIHNNFVQKLRRRIWNLRTYDKSRWEDAMHITLKLKTTPQPSNLPASTYVPFSSLPPPTHLVISHIGYYATFALNLNSRSKSNDKCNCSVSFSSALRTPPSSSARTQTPSLSLQDASEILSLLKALQQDMADVRDRITALERNDQCMARIEWHIGLQPLSSVSPNTTQTSDMNIDQLDVSNPSLMQNSLRAKPSSRPLNPLLPDFVPLTSPVILAHTSFLAVITFAPTIPSPQHASAEIQAINEKHSAIESKMDMLVASISGFIGSINTSSTSNSANTAGSQ
ncbi:hypothetical protein RclHR1_02660032 [Rhizophagus clarus]|uniref:Uncharacterized protein n=1 Tax=Rhizophagus clarus TaxID=94130 RepID=A0A2Z6RGH5_9GLOM|nr:hypothetical protein RclHR1_02660032 [Rhizophagus clarus]